MHALETSAIARWRSLAACAALAAAVGCQTPTLPNLNDPEDVKHASPAVLKQELDDAYAFFEDRAKRGEITEDQARQRLAVKAADMVAQIDFQSIPLAWRSRCGTATNGSPSSRGTSA